VLLSASILAGLFLFNLSDPGERCEIDVHGCVSVAMTDWNDKNEVDEDD